ncbi:MAG: DUF4382 domain-containing protein [Deltaproteobacteria bacterium]|nr:DUF4382 domain-containing protein [Deltaproteobacteria bacterium]
MIPAEDSDLEQVVIYQDLQGHTVNLLALRDEDLLFTVKDGIPAGVYEKIRLQISDIEPVPAAGVETICDGEMEIKLPSGKIDLNPQGGFAIVAGEMLSIKLDIDAEKSIRLHPAGKFRGLYRRCGADPRGFHCGGSIRNQPGGHRAGSRPRRYGGDRSRRKPVYA